MDYAVDHQGIDLAIDDHYHSAIDLAMDYAIHHEEASFCMSAQCAVVDVLGPNMNTEDSR